MYNGHLSIEEVEQLNQQKGPAENQSHLENCRQCHALLEKYQAVSAKLDKLASIRIGAKNGMNCPDERVWFDVAAGTLSSDDSLRYVQHAVECEACGHRLKSATRMFQEELTPEEEKKLQALPSAGPRQQKKLADQLVQASNGRSSQAQAIAGKRKRSFWWPVSFSLTGLAAAVAVIVFFALPRNSPAEVQKLLAQAYTEDRTIEMRIPYAKHAEIRQQRGADSGSLLNTPAAAREAADKIAARLKKDPDNPQWLILQAQLDLLDWRYRAALATLSRIETGTDQPDFLLTRAMALVEQGSIEHEPQLQGEALDLLAKILQKEPNNLVAVYNQALVCEDLRMYQCASNGWQQVIKIDKDAGWVAEARQHLNRIEEKKTLEK